MNYRSSFVLFLFCAFSCVFPSLQTKALTNGLALTPPMGYNSWYYWFDGINESRIKEVADMIATNGMKAAGYEYINMDDGWAGYRDSNGVMVANTNKFPNGIKAVADYVHSKGLKLGIYTVFGPTTCLGLPGSYGHEVQDAQTYAEWGIDYVKYEGCSFPNPLSVQKEKAFQMRDALMATGRPIVFTMSTGPVLDWFPDAFNTWRGTGDNDPSWTNFLYHLDWVARTPEQAGPGHWNDPDVLDIGRGWSTKTEDKAMFSMYCMVAAPLLVATPFPQHLDVLTNAEVIAVDQDVAGIQGVCVRTNGDLQVWCKSLGGSNSNVKAVALFNRGDQAASITALWSELGFPPGLATVRDLWSKVNEGYFENSYRAVIPAHGVKLIKMVHSPGLILPMPGTNYLSDLAYVSAANRTNIHFDKDALGKSLNLWNTNYNKGLGVLPMASIDYFLGGTASRFQCTIGVDDDAGIYAGSVVFRVYADGAKMFDSGKMMTVINPPRKIDLDISGKQMLTLEVTDSGDGKKNDYADWADARIVVSAKPRFLAAEQKGNSMVASGSGGVKDASYYVLSSTNLLDTASWKRVQTNKFDANGNFAFTNSINSNAPRVFYRLQVP